MKQISLTRGHIAIVDDQDFEVLSQFSWQAKETSHTTYAVRDRSRKLGKKKLFMHREILGLQDPSILVDHINGNGLDNRRENLRIATKAQNNINKSPKKNGTSKYLGVSWTPSLSKWSVQTCKDKKKIYIGVFNDEIEAAKAYDRKAVELHGEFAKTNFSIVNYLTKTI